MTTVGVKPPVDPPRVRRPLPRPGPALVGGNRRRALFGLPIDNVTLDEAVAICTDAIDRRHTVRIGVVNAAKLASSRHDPSLRNALVDCDLVVADGQSVVWASALLDRRLPERVAGIDLFERLLDAADWRGDALYLLGATPEVLAAVEERIRRDWPGARVVGSHHGYFAPEDAPAVVEHIRDCHPDLLFIATSSPMKERFIAQWASEIDVAVLHGVGGSFDVMAGRTRRAPLAYQRLGMEWAYRLLQEPRRLWRRYLTTNMAFLALVVKELLAPTPPVRRLTHDR
jgi:N-acetylglucosaminyldiphosphoundecaprenol N-acetyl-beta-D-mannosaminyltransferase